MSFIDWAPGEEIYQHLGFYWFAELDELHPGRGDCCTWGEIDPNQRRNNVTRFVPSPVKIPASLCASGYHFFLSDRFGHTSPNWKSSLWIRTASTSALKLRRASIRRCRHRTIQHLMWWVRLSGTRWPKTIESFRKDDLFLYLVTILI